MIQNIEKEQLNKWNNENEKIINYKKCTNNNFKIIKI
jgi:hypothetical protein